MAPLALALNLALQLALAAPEASSPPTPPAPARAAAAPAALDVATAAPLAPAALRLVPPPATPAARARLDPGPFRGRELVGATLGAFAGDALVLGSGYLALRMFAGGTIAPTATNFRRAVYGLGVSALVLPPATAVLLARVIGGPGAPGGLWKALLLATAGQAAALAAGYLAAPRFLVVLPVQAVALSVGATLGLHWGSHARATAGPEVESRGAPAAPAAPAAGTAALSSVPLCVES